MASKPQGAFLGEEQTLRDVYMRALFAITLVPAGAVSGQLGSSDL